MVKELAWSADARGLLFAAGVVLLEVQRNWQPFRPGSPGVPRPNDSVRLMTCTWRSTQSEVTRTFSPLISYLERFWRAVGGGLRRSGFRFDIGKHIFEQVLDAGVDGPELNKVRRAGRHLLQGPERNERNPLRLHEPCRQGTWVFTLAPGWHRKKEAEGDHESFEAL